MSSLPVPELPSEADEEVRPLNGQLPNGPLNESRKATSMSDPVQAKGEGATGGAGDAVNVGGATTMVEEPEADPTRPVVFDVDDLDVYYGSYRAVRDVNLDIRANEITAFIGPSGCGKTTVLRCFNRMNDLLSLIHI